MQEEVLKEVDVSALDKEIRTRSLELLMREEEGKICTWILKQDLSEGKPLLIAEIFAESIEEAFQLFHKRQYEIVNSTGTIGFSDNILEKESKNFIEERLKKKKAILHIKTKRGFYEAYLEEMGRREKLPVYPYRTIKETIEGINKILALKKKTEEKPA